MLIETAEAGLIHFPDLERVQVERKPWDWFSGTRVEVQEKGGVTGDPMSAA